VFTTEWAEAACDQDVLGIIEDRITALHTVRAVELDECMGRDRFASPDVIAVNSIIVAHAFVFHL
jgi:hypothetical protein